LKNFAIMSSNDKKLSNVVFVLGPPGSGKGTQCTRIQKEFGYIHLSAGDLLREERQREGSSYGALIEEHIRNGSIVPVEITCKLIENAMSAAGHPPGFLVDGFPRNQDNFDGWNREMGTKANVQFVLFLDCPQEVCVKRCLERNQGRSDDNEESLRKRVKVYIDQTKPIIDKYSTSGLVRQVDASKEPNTVFAEISQLFKKL